MKPRKRPRSVTLFDDLWNEVVKNADLIKYNNSQFMEACIEAIVEMINNPEKRRVPLVVKLVDQAKVGSEKEEILKDVITIPIRITDEHGKNIRNPEQKESVTEENTEINQ